MPLFEYACSHCGERFTLLVSGADASRETVFCVACRQACDRLLSTFATPGMRKERSRIVRDERMQSLLPYFAPRD